uniref:Secreted protein n=1 Tax=Arundo donax TaxID=35708 RepID=A0A0A9FCK0_ARUDO
MPVTTTLLCLVSVFLFSTAPRSGCKATAMAIPERAPARRPAPRRRREPNSPPTPPWCLRCFSFSPEPQAADKQAARSQVHSGGATAAAIAHSLDPGGATGTWDHLDSRRGPERRRGRIHRLKKRRCQGPGSARCVLGASDEGW